MQERELRIGNYGLAQAFAAVVGAVLVGAGVLGFINPNPITGTDPNALFRANAVHAIVHLVTGALALYIAFGLSGETQANALIGFGVLYAVIFVLVLLSPTLFGLFGDAPANAGDHVLHAALAVASLAVGYLAKSRTAATAATR